MLNRKFSFFLCSFLFPILIYSQSFFPSDSAVWKEVHLRIGTSNTSPRMRRIIMSGDTIVNGMQYKFLDISHMVGIHLIRLDSTEKKVFLQPRGQGIGSLPVGDNLFYDFGVTVGDSIPIIDLYLRDTLHWVVIRDSVQEFGGKMLRFLDVYRDYYGTAQVDRWVEGIGSLSGFLAPFDEPSGWFEFRYQQVCFQDFSDGYQYEHDSLWYDYINCNATLSSDGQAFVKSPIKLGAYPNPFKSYMRIANNSESFGYYRLTTISGSQVLADQLQPYQDLKITTEHLPSGFYVIELRSDSGITRKKIYKYK